MKRPPLSERFAMSGLTKEGKIDAYNSCPFLNTCGSTNKRCPTDIENYGKDFSCAISRAYAIQNYYKLVGENK